MGVESLTAATVRRVVNVQREPLVTVSFRQTAGREILSCRGDESNPGGCVPERALHAHVHWAIRGPAANGGSHFRRAVVAFSSYMSLTALYAVVREFLVIVALAYASVVALTHLGGPESAHQSVWLLAPICPTDQRSRHSAFGTARTQLGRRPPEYPLVAASRCHCCGAGAVESDRLAY